ncbi:uncharacterized protein V6R79_018224 [Siganus canaliculatus]
MLRREERSQDAATCGINEADDEANAKERNLDRRQRREGIRSQQSSALVSGRVSVVFLSGVKALRRQ